MWHFRLVREQFVESLMERVSIAKQLWGFTSPNTTQTIWCSWVKHTGTGLWTQWRRALWSVKSCFSVWRWMNLGLEAVRIMALLTWAWSKLDVEELWLAQSPDLNPIEDLQGEIAGTRPSCPTCLSSAKHCGKQSLWEEWKLLLLQRVGH